MNLSDKDMETLFQDMDKKASFEFQDAYWTEMEQLLATKKSKKKITWWLNSWILFPTLLVFATVGTIGVLTFRNTTDKTAKHQNQLQNVQKDTNLVTKSSAQAQNEFLINENNTNKTTENTVYSPEIAKTKSATTNIKNSKLNTKPTHIQAENNEKIILAKANNVENKVQTILPTQENTTLKEKNLAVTTDSISTQPIEKEIVTTTKNQTETAEQSIFPTQEDVKSPKSKWRMYVGAGAGMSASLQRNNSRIGAGIFRFEYGTEKSFNRFLLGLGVGVENSFGTSLSISHKYVSYDLVRHDNEQVYAYNRFTNFFIPVRLGVSLGENYRSQLLVTTMPAFSMYNNLIYKEISDNNLVAKDEFWNQNIGLNRFYMNVGIGYNFMLTNNLLLGFEYNNNLGTNRQNSFQQRYDVKADNQFIIHVRYYIK